jgi:hypothetical protein
MFNITGQQNIFVSYILFTTSGNLLNSILVYMCVILVHIELQEGMMQKGYDSILILNICFHILIYTACYTHLMISCATLMSQEQTHNRQKQSLNVIVNASKI